MRRISFAILLFTLLLTSLPLCMTAAAATATDRLFAEANEAYSHQDYQQAIEKYTRIIDTAGYAPAVLYNLANSYALSGQTGRAILNYERALRLSPTDSDILGNLELVQKEKGLFAHESTAAVQFFHLLSLNQWTMLILLSLILLTICLAAAMKYHFSRRLSVGAVICCILLAGLGAAGTAFCYQDYNPAVVIAPDTKMLVSPFASSASAGTVPEGRLVFPRKNHGDFSYVVDELGRQGWIDSRRIEAVNRPAGSGS